MGSCPNKGGGVPKGGGAHIGAGAYKGACTYMGSHSYKGACSYRGAGTFMCPAHLPNEWKSAHITPVSKGGDNEIVRNFRPVSVLPVVVKVFERLVHQQLYTYLQENSLLHSTQFGFRPGHSTQDALVSLVDE